MNLPCPLPETPFYLYDMNLLRRTLDAINKAKAARPDFIVHYAVKANVCPPILHEVASAGLGADTVSAGEIQLALENGFHAGDIMFAGVGKTDQEINFALDSGIGCFNVESIPELEVIADLAFRRGMTARVALRINPDIDAHTHHYITTGLAENKFGIPMSMLDKAVDMAVALPSIDLAGLHFHIGSQITIAEPFALLCERINRITSRLAERGISLRIINVGGGLGVDYDNPDTNPVPDFDSYFSTFASGLEHVEGRTIHFELGRAIVAQCGSLVSRCLYVKEGEEKTFAIVDAGMSDLIRPALYQARHAVTPLYDPDSSSPLLTYDIVGPVCESADVFGEDYVLPRISRGDAIAFRSAGAYGEVMSSRYNCRKLNPSVFL